MMTGRTWVLAAGLGIVSLLIGCREKSEPAAGGSARSSSAAAQGQPATAPQTQPVNPLAEQTEQYQANIAGLREQLQSARAQVQAAEKERDAARGQAAIAENAVATAKYRAQEQAARLADLDGRVRQFHQLATALADQLKAAGGSAVVFQAEAEKFDTLTDVWLEEVPDDSGQSIVLDKPTSAAEITFTLKPGIYQAALFGAGKNDQTDLVQVTISAADEQTGVKENVERVCFDRAWNKVVEGRPTSLFAVAEEGKVRLALRLGRKRQVFVDRLEIRLHVPPPKPWATQ